MNPQNFTPIKVDKNKDKKPTNMLNTILIIMMIVTVAVLAVVLFLFIQQKLNFAS